MVRGSERGQAGLPDRDAARLPLTEHLVSFESDMALGLAAKGGKNTSRRVRSEMVAGPTLVPLSGWP